MQYFERAREKKLLEIRKCQCLLTEQYTFLLTSAVPGEGVSISLLVTALF